MSSFIVLGTDTDVGKTAFSLLWLNAFAARYAYWKPIETGPSDTERIRQLVPRAEIFPPVCALAEPVAPPLAARRAGTAIPGSEEILARRPQPERRFLLVESFGSPFSPLDETHLQVDLLRRLALPCVLVSASTLGVIGRTLQCLNALAQEGIETKAIILIGAEDAYARERLERHAALPVVGLMPPGEWTTTAFAAAAARQGPALHALATLLGVGKGGSLPRGEFALAGGERLNVRARDRAAVWHPYTALSAAPDLVCVGAEDEFLILDDGRRLVDAVSSWWTILHGHRDADLVRALRDAAARIDHVLFAGVTHPWGVELAELLLQSAGMTGGKCFYSDNGSTAVEVALKLAYQFWCLEGRPQRTRFIGFEHGYHGDTFGAMAVSRDPLFFGRFTPLLFQADILPLDAAALDQCLRQTANKTAAVIVEPLVQGAGGMRMHTPETLAELFAVARKHDVLVIADEVMTRGRTGSVWAFQQAGIAPDLVCCAKTLAGGMLPLAATLVNPRVVAPFLSAAARDTFFHGHSFTGHPLACAVGLESWRKLQGDAGQDAHRLECFWKKALAPWGGRRGVRDVRIRGTIATVELEAEGGYLAEAKARMAAAAEREGVFLRPLGDVLYALPPLCTSQESLERIVNAFEAALGVLEQGR